MIVPRKLVPSLAFLGLAAAGTFWPTDAGTAGVAPSELAFFTEDYAGAPR